jgi:phage virion morphogenesis protein
MAGVSFVLDDDLAQRALSVIDRAAANPVGAYHAIGAHFVFSTQRNFELERSPDGTPWQRLSPRTAAKRLGKGRRGYDHMLRVTTRLYRSISYQVLDDGVEWGTNLVYGRIHQLGGVVDMPPRQGTVTLKSIRRKGGGVRSRFARRGAKGAVDRVVSIRGHQVRIPARPYLGISAKDRQDLPEIVADYIRSEVGQ